MKTPTTTKLPTPRDHTTPAQPHSLWLHPHAWRQLWVVQVLQPNAHDAPVGGLIQLTQLNLHTATTQPQYNRRQRLPMSCSVYLCRQAPGGINSWRSTYVHGVLPAMQLPHNALCTSAGGKELRSYIGVVYDQGCALHMIPSRKEGILS